MVFNDLMGMGMGTQKSTDPNMNTGKSMLIFNGDGYGALSPLPISIQLSFLSFWVISYFTLSSIQQSILRHNESMLCHHTGPANKYHNIQE